MRYTPIPKSVSELTYVDGRLFWPSGKEAGTKTKEGYIRVKYRGVSYLAHRVVWRIFHGDVPDLHIDHINGDTVDNRVENLRPTTNGENFANTPKIRSSSGYRGVYPSRERWKVLCAEKYLRVYKTKEEAAGVFDAYAQELWGDFWRDRVGSDKGG